MGKERDEWTIPFQRVTRTATGAIILVAEQGNRLTPADFLQRDEIPPH